MGDVAHPSASRGLLLSAGAAATAGLVTALPAPRALAPATVTLAVVLAARVLGRHTRCGGVAARYLADPPARTGSGRRWWEAIGVLGVAAAFAGLELRQPHYFCQDDVLVGELPGHLFALRCVWDGCLPEYCPHYFLGGPLLSLGMFQLTYPPLYLCYAAARHLFGDETLLPEVGAALHLAVGYALTRRLAGAAGMGRAAAVVAAQSFVLSGSVLMMGRSWSSFLPAVVWLPALMLGVRRLAAGPVGAGWVAGMAAAVGAYFQIGFPQNPAFACGFVLAGVGYLAAAGVVPWRRAALVAPALIGGAAVAAPLLVQQQALMVLVDRGPTDGGDISKMLPSLLFPYPLASSDHPMGWGNVDTGRMGHLAFGGGLLAGLCLVEAAALAVAPAWPAAGRAGRVWLVLAALAFVLTLGEWGGLWAVGGHLPVVSSLFRYPFRLLPALTLFASLAGGLTLDRLLRRMPPAWGAAVVTGALAVLAYHVWLLTPAFYVYGFTPYPPLPGELRPAADDAAAGRGRFFVVDPEPRVLGDPDPRHTAGLPFNLPMVYGVPSFEGYCPLLENRVFAGPRERVRSDPAAARAYGARWVLASDRSSRPDHDVDKPLYWLYWHVRYREAFDLLRPGLRRIDARDGVTLYELPGAAPLAFASDRPGIPLPLEAGGFGLAADVSVVPAGRDVTLNFLWYPEMRAAVDGRPVGCGPDGWGRVAVRLPEAGHRLTVRYAPRWGKGFVAATVLGLAAVLATSMLLRAAPDPATPRKV